MTRCYRLNSAYWRAAVMAHAHTSEAKYVPAAGFRWLTRFYDPFVAFTMREREFRQAFIERARIGANSTVLDVGCGTGTLAVMIKTSVPSATVVGLDGDPEVLEIAREKAAKAGADGR